MKKKMISESEGDSDGYNQQEWKGVVRKEVIFSKFSSSLYDNSY